MARIWTGIKSGTAHLRRLAVVFEDELDLKIVTELYMRVMSPKEFHAEFGGGSLSRIDKHFKKLAKDGWLRYLHTKTGGPRHGGSEHFYRTTELAIFDNETWSLLPYSMRLTSSWMIFRQFTERVRDALRAGTFDARADRHFTWTPLLLDRLGWEQVIAALDSLFVSLFEEQIDARIRIFDSGEKSILVTVALAGFESVMPGAERVGLPTLVEIKESPVPFPVRFSKAIADELCLKIVEESNLREISVTQFHRELGGASKSGIRSRFTLLSNTDWATRVNEKTGGRRRGATEHFYRATRPAIYDNSTWAKVPDSIKTMYSWTIFEQFSEHFKEAMHAGVVDARKDRHLTWSLLRLDQQGWENMIATVDALFAFIFKEQESAKIRMEKSGEKPIKMTVALAAFESPKAGKEP